MNSNMWDADGHPAISRRRLLELGASGGAAVFLAGCGSGTKSTSSSSAASPASTAGVPKAGGKLRVGLLGAGKAETLDPHKQVQQIDLAVSRQLYSTLAIQDAQGNAVPFLAESLEPNADATVWQVKLRKGVTFHSGKALDADDVLASFKRILDPKTASGGATAISMLDLARSKKVSASEVRLVLKTPFSDFDKLLMLKETAIVPQGLKDFSKPDGTGPFKLVSWRAGARGEFQRFDGFFMDKQPYVDELTTLSIDDGAARLNALLGGQVDAIDSLDFAQAKAQASSSRIQVVRSSSAHCYPFYMKTDAAPFTDVRVRQAMRLAIDRPKILQTAYLGFGQLGNDMFGVGTSTYNPDLPQRTYDPEQAKSLLAAAGKSDLKVELNCAVPYIGLPQAALAYAQQAKAAGITIDVKQNPSDKYFTDIYLKVPFGTTDWSQSWTLFLSACCTPKGAYDETKFYPPRFQELLKSYQSSSDATKKKAAIMEMQQIQHDQGGYVIPAFADNVDAISPKVKGIDTKLPDRLGNYQFRQIWMA